jgi:peptide/nickel transport system ATP-binding protein
MSLLDITDLTVTYSTDSGTVHAVNDVSFSIDEGVNYGLAGESGSGKSTLAEAVLGLLPSNGSVESGSIEFKGRDLTGLSERERRDVLWEDIAYIPQSAMDSLDPVMSTGSQIRQAIQTHRNVTDDKARARVRELFEIVGLDPDRIDDYPHEFSGGMRQRVTIAMALALEPDLIIADEPTTGLDVIVQDKIIDKILEIQDRMDSSLLLITHEIGVIAETCDELSILYGGRPWNREASTTSS